MAAARLAREVDGARREPAPDRTDGTD